ncbi:hypothetical protein BGZ98_006873, partial [Dissophora globulifera]
IAHNTRFYDTCAHEIIKSGQGDTEFGKSMLKFLNTVRIAAANDSAKISRMRSKLYYTALGIKHEPAKEGSILKVEEVAANKAASDLIRKVYKKPEQKATNNKTYQQDSGSKSSWKQKSSGSNQKSKEQQTFKKKKQASKDDKTGYKSSNKSSSKH